MSESTVLDQIRQATRELRAAGRLADYVRMTDYQYLKLVRAVEPILVAAKSDEPPSVTGLPIEIAESKGTSAGAVQARPASISRGSPPRPARGRIGTRLLRFAREDQMPDYEDEDDFLESPEGQAWARDFDRSSKAFADSVRKLRLAFEGVADELRDLRFDREVRPGGFSDLAVRKLLKDAGGE